MRACFGLRSGAAVAQWIEYWPPKPRVVGSIPASRTSLVRKCKTKRKNSRFVFDVKNAATIEFFGGVPEWLKGADCKSVGLRLHWFESSPLHQFLVEEFEDAVAGIDAQCSAGVVQW